MGLVSVKVRIEHPAKQMWALLKDGSSKLFSSEKGTAIDEELVTEEMRTNGWFLFDEVKGKAGAKAEGKSKKEETTPEATGGAESAEVGVVTEAEGSAKDAPAESDKTEGDGGKPAGKPNARKPKGAAKKAAPKKAAAKKGK